MPKVSLFSAAAMPMRLHMRTDLHLFRKAWHMTMGLLIAFVYLSGISRTTGVLILGFILAVVLMLEAARLKTPAVNELILRIWGPIMRTNEVSRMSAIPHYLSATILAVAIFPKPVAILATLYLALGDPIASLFGILYGSRSVRLKNGKSVIGTLAGILTCMVVTVVFLKIQSIPDDTILPLMLVGGLAGGLAEHVPMDVDDNFTIPIISGFVLWLAFIVLGL